MFEERMKSSSFLCLIWLSVAFGCKVEFPFSECSFDGFLTLVNPTTGYTIATDTCGIEIDKETFAEQPFVFLPDALPNEKYTLIMVDIGEENSYLHWLVNDIDGQSLKYGLGIDSGNTVAAYVSPDPQETCVHRYSISIFEQQDYPFDLPEMPEHRADFDLRYFLENTEGEICGPVASIEFKARY